MLIRQAGGRRHQDRHATPVVCWDAGVTRTVQKKAVLCRARDCISRAQTEPDPNNLVHPLVNRGYMSNTHVIRYLHRDSCF